MSADQPATRIDERDVAVVAAQLGRPPRSIHAVGHRCPCGNPDVVSTEPRLDDGTPFPTTFYLTCPRAASLIGTLEASGLMREMSDRLTEDDGLAAAYAGAHQRYLEARAAIGEVPEIAGVSAGGMPERVKCLHVLAGQSLAQGRGREPARRRGARRARGVVGRGTVRLGDRGRRMTRVAAFDCGTNSLRLLISDLDAESGTSTELVREMRIVRLGQGVDRTGRLSEAALQRVFSAVEELMVHVREHDVAKVAFCATSAARDAENAEDFLSGVRERVGVRPEILDGDAEARTSFAGATRTLPPLPDPILVLDIGGGSTELILGNADGTVLAAQSLDIGSVRLNERHLAGDPPSREEIAAAVADIDAALDACEVDPAAAGAVIGVAGTVTTLAAAVLDLATYDSTVIHHSVLRPDAVQGAVTRLLSMMIEQRKALGYMHPGRADVIGAGGLILDRILRRTTVNSLLVSEHDILDGIAWSLVTPARSTDGKA